MRITRLTATTGAALLLAGCWPLSLPSAPPSIAPPTATAEPSVDSTVDPTADPTGDPIDDPPVDDPPVLDDPGTEPTSDPEEPAPTEAPTVSAVIDGVTTLYGDWHEIEDPAAPGYGHVITDGTYTVWLPGFQAIPFGAPEAGEIDYMDPAGRELDPAAVQAQYLMAIQPIPRSTCALPWESDGNLRMPEGVDPTEVQAGAQEYVDCLLGLWQPLADATGASFLNETYPVKYCSVPENAGERNCADESLMSPGWYEYFRQTIFVGKDQANAGTYLPNLSALLAHEVGHLLQSELSTGNGNVIRAITMGMITDLSGDRQDELNAECLAAGMVADPGTADIDLQAMGLLGEGDEFHWGAESHYFWTQQGLGGHVGDCNTWLASQSLLAYP